MRLRRLSTAFMAVMLTTSAAGQNADQEATISNYAPEPVRVNEGINAINSNFGLFTDLPAISYSIAPEPAEIPASTPLPTLPTPIQQPVDYAVAISEAAAYSCSGAPGIVGGYPPLADLNDTATLFQQVIDRTFDCLSKQNPGLQNHKSLNQYDAHGAIDIAATFQAHAVNIRDMMTWYPAPSLYPTLGAQMGVRTAILDDITLIAPLPDEPTRMAYSLTSLGYQPQ